MLGPVDTLSILSYVPAAVSMKKLLSVIKKRGVSPDRIAEAEAAFLAFEEFVRSAATDRDRLETMLMSFGDSDEGRQVDLQHRKAASRAHSHFYGIEVDTAVNTLLYYPGSTPDRLSCVALQQISGMRRLRADTEVVVTRLNMTDEHAEKRVVPCQVIDEAAALRYGAPVIEDFCSRPMPALSTILGANGLYRTILTSRQLGSAAEMELAFGRAWPDLPIELDTDGRHFLSALIPATRPTQLFVGDMFVHRSLSRSLEPSVGVWAQVVDQPNQVSFEPQGIRLPVREEFLRIGSGEDMARIRELPRYTELLRMACDRFGINSDELTLYRFRLSYPLVDSLVILKIAVTP